MNPGDDSLRAGRTLVSAMRWKSGRPRLTRSLPAIFILVFFIFLFNDVSAAGLEVTLQDAYRMAIKSHEDVRIAGEDIIQAKSDVGKATADMLPHITAEALYTQYNTKKTVSGFLLQPDNSIQWNLKVSQSLFSGGVEWNARRAAKLYLRRTHEGLEGSRETVMVLTARAYFSVLKADKDIEIKEAALKRARERREVARARFDVGEVTKSAVLRAESDVAGAEADLITSESALKDSTNLLKRYLGKTGDIIIKDPGVRVDMRDDVEDLVAAAYKNRLDFKQTVLDRDIASIGVKSVKGEFLPTLSVEGNYERRERDPATSFLLKESVSATLTLSYPIFQGGLKRAELYGARSKLREEELRVRGLKKDIAVEVREAFNDFRAKKAVIDAFRRQLAFAEEDYRMVFEQFKSGVATTVDVIDSDTELISAQSSLMNAAYDLQLAAVELKYAVGRLREDFPG